jgi:PAS domain S-box-containing protein
MVKRVREAPGTVAGHRRLIHELEAHKIELEMQNQALREDRDQLEKSRSRYAELYDYAPVGHVTLDRTGAIEELNVAAATMLGKDRRFVRGRRLRTLLARQSRAHLDAHIRTCLFAAQPVSVELMVPMVGGGFRAIELVSMPPQSIADERPPTFHSVLTDVTSRKHDHERRELLFQGERQARLVAEDVNRAKENFLAVVSHELRTPLVPMMMWIKALRAGGMSESLRRRAIEAIDTCLEIQVAMIDDLVDVARGQNGKLRVLRRPLDLQPIVAAAIEAIAPSAAAKQIRVTYEVDATPAWVAGDSLRLRQVVANLLSNAVKFTREGGNIAVTLHAHGSDITLGVRDDGEGMDPALLASAFDPFRQRDMDTTRRHSGLGLGLTIVRQLVDQHDGRVHAESAGPGRGSCFVVTLPRCDEMLQASAAPTLPALPELPKTAVELEGVRVLVVEDDGPTREALAMGLRMQGAVVVSASSAAEAREALARARPHVLLSDIGMPAEDGYTLIRTVRDREAKAQDRRRLPALALTANGTANDRMLALSAGFDGHIAKPVDFERLVSMIGALARVLVSPVSGPKVGGPS